MARARASTGVRRFGYVVAILVNAAMLYAVNAWPGWEEVPVLTTDTEQVIGWVTASIVTSLVANAIYLVRDPPWLRSLGDVITTSVGLGALVKVWQVFPFDVASDSSGWGLVARILLVVAIVGSAIGIVTGLVGFVKAVSAAPAPR